MRREYDQEIRQIGELKKALEAESTARAEFEARYKNVKKEMDFQNNLYKEVSVAALKSLTGLFQEWDMQIVVCWL